MIIITQLKNQARKSAPEMLYIKVLGMGYIGIMTSRPYLPPRFASQVGNQK